MYDFVRGMVGRGSTGYNIHICIGICVYKGDGYMRYKCFGMSNGLGMLLRVVYTVYLLFLMPRTYYTCIYNTYIIIITRQWSENDTPSLIDNRALWGLHIYRDVYNNNTCGVCVCVCIYIKDTKRLNGCRTAAGPP